MHFRKTQPEGRTRSRRLSYANIAATLALVIAVGGGTAWAAKHIHYKITSTNQIKPSVIKKLRGNNGTNGTNGTNGAQGAVGATGATGAAGAPGAVAGYSASNTSAVTIPSGGSDGTFATVVSKVLPAGSYLVTAKSSVNATANSGQTGNVAPECDLDFNGSFADLAQAQGPLGPGILSIASYTATLVVEAPLTSASAVTVTLQCENQLGTQTNLSVAAANSQIQAVQTSHNS